MSAGIRTRVAIAAAIIVTVITPGSASAGGGGGWGGPGSALPDWARSVRLSVRDDSSRPVHFIVFVRGSDHDHSYRGCGNTLKIALPHGSTDYFVEARAGVDQSCPNVLSTPTSGMIDVTYLGRRGRRASERLTYDLPGGVGSG